MELEDESYSLILSGNKLRELYGRHDFKTSIGEG